MERVEVSRFFQDIENCLSGGGNLAAQHPGPPGTRLGLVLDHRLADSAHDRAGVNRPRLALQGRARPSRMAGYLRCYPSPAVAA